MSVISKKTQKKQQLHVVFFNKNVRPHLIRPISILEMTICAHFPERKIYTEEA